MPHRVHDTHLSLPKPARLAARGACLVHIYPAGPLLGRRYPLPDHPARVGRTDDCEVRLDDNAASRRHAELTPGPCGYAVADLGSTNGTYVNDDRVEGARWLRDGDYLKVGGAIFRYLAGGNVEADYHEELYRLTVLDGLTRVHNRRALDEFLDREAARTRRYGRPLSVLLFDVDRFKAINDGHGHPCGDFVLRALADRVRPLVRAEDLLARYGGEEFALALVEADHGAALAAGERVRAAVAAEPFAWEGVSVRVTVSVGVATSDGSGDGGPAVLLKAADDRLYEAKRGGRNRVVGDPDFGDADSTALSNSGEQTQLYVPTLGRPD